MATKQPEYETERLRRWRLVLGASANDELCPGGAESLLNEMQMSMDSVLQALYDEDKRTGSLSKSSPNVARWLGDIRTYFPTPSVHIMQQDAIDRLGLTQLLLEEETLEQVDPDVNLVATLVSLSKAIPEETKDTAHRVVRQVADQLERKLASQLIQAVRGSLNRASRTYRPRANEIDWQRTIQLNLKNYQPEHKTIIAERLVGYGHRRSSLRDIVLCVDQSGSMATSVVYSSIFGAVLATVRAVSTRMIVFDTAVVDLTEELTDPVDLLFGTQLGGGTDINRALTYCQQTITRPEQTILVLITDLYEGGNAEALVDRLARLSVRGVNVIVLLALTDTGRPSYDPALSAKVAALGIPVFACTPDQFPDLMATALKREDVAGWAADQDIKLIRPEA